MKDLSQRVRVVGSDFRPLQDHGLSAKDLEYIWDQTIEAMHKVAMFGLIDIRLKDGTVVTVYTDEEECPDAIEVMCS